MKKRIFPLIVLLTIILVGISTAASPIAVVRKAKGAISVTRAESKKTSQLKRGARLYSGDKIVTGKKSYAAILFTDDRSTIRIRANSTCTINGKQEKNTIAKNIYVEVGTIFSQIFKQKSSFKVSTPTSVASVKGTKFWTKQEFKGATFYYGEEGIFEVSNKSGSALVKADETCYVASSESKPVVTETKDGDKPKDDDEVGDLDEFEFQFENSEGESKTMQFKIKQNN